MKRGLAVTWGAGVLGVVTGAIATLAPGCGKPANSGDVESRVIPVEGRAWFRTECQDGGVGDPYPRPLDLFKCDIPVERVALTQDLPEVTVMGDCIKNTITVRRNGKSDTWELMRNLDYTSSFDIDINDFPNTTLREDGSGTTNCSARLSLNLFGKMACQPGADARYKADIAVEAIWWVNKSTLSPTPTPTATPTPVPTPTVTLTPVPIPLPSNSPIPQPTPTRTSGVSVRVENAPVIGMESALTACNLPPQCYFYTSTNIKQCR